MSTNSEIYKDLDERQKTLLEVMFSEEHWQKSLREKAILAGYPPQTNMTQVLCTDVMSKAVIEKTKQHLTMNGPKIAMSLLQVLDDPHNPGNSVTISAAKELLDRIGVVKQDKMEVEVNIPNALLILPEKNKED